MSELILKLTEPMPGGEFRGRGWDDLGFRIGVRGGKVLPGLTAAERSVLWVYREHADRRGEAWPGNEALALATGLDARSVTRARCGLVRKERLAEAADQDKRTKKMVVLMPAAVPVEGVGGGQDGRGGGDRAVGGGVTGLSPEACSEERREEQAGRAGDSASPSPEVSEASGGGQNSGGVGPLFAGPAGYDAEATRLLVGLGVKVEVARGLVGRYRPTLAELAVVVEVMDAMDGAEVAGLKDGNGKPIAAVRRRGKFVEGAVKNGSYGKPRWMGRLVDAESKRRERAAAAEREAAEREAKVAESAERAAVWHGLSGAERARWLGVIIEEMRGQGGTTAAAAERLTLESPRVPGWIVDEVLKVEATR